jgi:hypothetical protein
MRLAISLRAAAMASAFLFSFIDAGISGKSHRVLQESFPRAPLRY